MSKTRVTICYVNSEIDFHQLFSEILTIGCINRCNASCIAYHETIKRARR
jgi:hypothetical protein